MKIDPNSVHLRVRMKDGDWAVTVNGDEINGGICVECAAGGHQG